MTIPYMGVFSGTHPARTLVPARATLVPAETKKRVKMSILAAFGTGRHNPSEGVVPAFKGILQSKSSSRHGRHNGTGVSGMIRKYVGKGGVPTYCRSKWKYLCRCAGPKTYPHIWGGIRRRK